jgi:hypothetical protein
MENPLSSTSLAFGGKRKEAAVSKKQTVFMHIAIPASIPPRLDKSNEEVSSTPSDILQLHNIAIIGTSRILLTVPTAKSLQWLVDPLAVRLRSFILLLWRACRPK